MRAQSGRAEEPPALQGRGSWRLWVALGLAPLAWFAAQNAGYFFVPWACARANGEWVLHGIALAALALCIASGLLGLALLRTVGAGGEDHRDDAVQRVRFLARLAIAGSILFALIMITQWIAIALLDPCMPYPRSPFTPDARSAVEAIDYALR